MCAWSATPRLAGQPAIVWDGTHPCAPFLVLATLPWRLAAAPLPALFLPFMSGFCTMVPVQQVPPKLEPRSTDLCTATI